MTDRTKIKPYRIKRRLWRFICRSYAVMAGKNKNPRATLEMAERWSGKATLTIFVGIIFDLIPLLWSIPPNWPIQPNHILVCANVLIAAGLAIEYRCILVTIAGSRKLQIEMDGKLARALNRAANAEHELIRFRTPRSHLLNAALITERLKPFAGTQFDTGLIAGPGEPMHFLWNLEPAIVAAGWKHLNWVGSEVTTQGLRPFNGLVWADDVEIHIRQAEEPALRPAGDALISVLGELGIAARFAGFNTFSINVSTIHVLVGLKA